jgi:dsDNA-binding SOS-regulon protein
MTDFERDKYDQMMEHAHSLLDETVTKSLWEKGRSMTTDEAIRLALEE